MDRSWLIHESPALKPDWLGYIKLFSGKRSYMLLHSFKYFSSNRKQRYRLKDEAERNRSTKEKWQNYLEK